MACPSRSRSRDVLYPGICLNHTPIRWDRPAGPGARLNDILYRDIWIDDDVMIAAGMDF